MSRALPRARAGTRVRAAVPGLVMTPELVERFFAHLKERGRTEETIYTYRGHLDRLRAYLGEDAVIVPGTLDRFGQQMLEEGYSPNTVNICFAAVNSFLEFCNRRDLQVAKLEKVVEAQPELTRLEYCRILMAARQLGREREYLLVKLFASTGVNTSDLSKVTVEAVQDGAICVDGIAGNKTRLPLADGLRRELLAYVDRQGILTGPIFRSRDGSAMKRSNVAARISGLAKTANVDAVKCNPRCLQRLYKDTQDSIRRELDILAQHMHMQLLEKEQGTLGWYDDSGAESEPCRSHGG